MGCGASTPGKAGAIATVKGRNRRGSIASATCLHCGEYGHERFDCPTCPEEIKQELREKRQSRIKEGEHIRVRRGSIDTYLGESPGGRGEGGMSPKLGKSGLV